MTTFADLVSQSLQATESKAKEYPDYDFMLELQRLAGMAPKIQTRELRPGVHGQYQYAGESGPEITLNERYLASRPGGAPSTLYHEAVHGARSASGVSLGVKYQTEAQKAAWKKLGEDPGAAARKIAPAWMERHKDYRASPEELGAWAKAAMVDPASDYYSAPAHVNATIAQEFDILLDLAFRSLKGKTK